MKSRKHQLGPQGLDLWQENHQSQSVLDVSRGHSFKKKHSPSIEWLIMMTLTQPFVIPNAVPWLSL
jgi:hypothetical protein